MGKEGNATAHSNSWRRERENLVNHHWRMIEDLAKALLERQSLTGKEVGDVLGTSLQAQMQEDRLRRQTL
jgi:hypothetical protein